jgi:asparaginyl-tRNA synthetase
MDIHIDESQGSDSTGSGTSTTPYQSLAHALFAHGPSPPLKLLIRKDSTSAYEEPTQSALKKARKGAEGLVKKQKKQLELEGEKERERERKEKVLEASKQIVLVEDPSLPKPTKVHPVPLSKP